MDAKFAHQIAQLKNVSAALVLLKAACSGSGGKGGLQIQFGSLRAWLSFSGDTITGAAISSGQTGYLALTKIMSLGSCTLQLLYQPPEELTGGDKLNVSFDDALKCAVTSPMDNWRDGRHDRDFDAIDPQLNKPVPTLTDDQKSLLQMAQTSMSDRELFDEHLGVLQESGMFLTDEQKAALGEHLSAVSPEQQKEIFAKRDRRLAEEDGRSQFYAFEDFQQDSTVVEQLDAIATPEVRPEDYLALLPGVEGRLPVEAPKPLTAWQRFDRFVVRGKRGLRRARQVFPIGKVMLAFTVVSLSIGIVILPEWIKASTALVAGRFGQAQLFALLQQQVAHAMPSVLGQFESAPEQSANDRPAAGGYWNTESSLAAKEEDKLAQARQLIAQGELAPALSAYEQFIKANPERIDVRIEYVRALYTAKKRDKARSAAMDALKHKVTAAERDVLWDLIRACVFKKD